MRIQISDAMLFFAISGRRQISLPARHFSQADITRVKSWLDLAADVLTETVDETSEHQRQWLRKKVNAGLTQLQRGEHVDGEEAFDRILNRNRSDWIEEGCSAELRRMNVSASLGVNLTVAAQLDGFARDR